MITNVSVFIVICIINKDVITEEQDSTALLCITVIYLTQMIISVLCFMMCVYHKEGVLLYLKLGANYKQQDILLDILLLLLCLSLTKWNITVFSIITTVAFLLDIVLNSISNFITTRRIRIRHDMDCDFLKPFCPMCTILNICWGSTLW